MIKYAEIVEKDLGLVNIGLDDNSQAIEFYKSIGYKEMNVKQSDIDNQWYLYDKCPTKTIEQKEMEKKRAKIEEIKLQLKEVDEKSIRALRDGDIEYIEKYKQEAIFLREQLHELGGF